MLRHKPQQIEQCLGQATTEVAKLGANRLEGMQNVVDCALGVFGYAVQLLGVHLDITIQPLSGPQVLPLILGAVLRHLLPGFPVGGKKRLGHGCTHGRWIDDADPDAAKGQLDPQGVGVGLQGKFGGIIGRIAWQTDNAIDTADQHDPALCLAQGR